MYCKICGIECCNDLCEKCNEFYYNNDEYKIETENNK